MEEVEIISDNSTQTDVDKVLQTVSDDYLRRKKRKNRIAFSIISFVVLALSILIITFSAIKVDLQPFFISEPSHYTITLDGSTSPIPFDTQNSKYNEFVKIYDNSFEFSYLSAMFMGSLGGYEIEETSNNFYSTFNNGVGSGRSSTLREALGNNYVHLYYGVEQKLYSSNGKVYFSKRNTTEYELKYVDVYFPLTTENKSGDLTFYFGTYGYSKEPRITKITVKANTYKLYDFVSNL